MKFTSDFDYKALSACLQYYEISKREANVESKFLEKRPEYQFGKWLVTMLHERNRMDELGTLNSFAKRIMQEILYPKYK